MRRGKKSHPVKLFNLTSAIHAALEQIRKERIKDMEVIGKLDKMQNFTKSC